MTTIQELNNRLAEIEREKKGIGLEDALREEMKNYKGDDEVISFLNYKEKHKDFIKKGFSSGCQKLDEFIDGFHDGDLITITATTGQGKTSYCQYLTSNLSKQGIKTIWFEYEVPINNFLQKFGENLPNGYLPQVLTDRSLVWIERKIVEAITKFDIKVVFIDHLHYLFNLRETRNVSLEIGEIMRTLKIIAKKYNISIFLVAHTGKLGEDGAVGLDSIRDSSFVGQESDYVIALWRIREKQTRRDIQDNGIRCKNETMISVVKNRYTGRLGSFKTMYDFSNNNYLTEFKDEYEIS